MELAPIFQAVQQVMESHRLEFNQLDEHNHDHGDHMADIFRIAAQAAMDNTSQDMSGDELSTIIENAAALLRGEIENGSAQVYADGLASLAAQIRKYQIGLPDLILYTHGWIADVREKSVEQSTIPSGDVLKALVAALAGWEHVDKSKGMPTKSMDLGYMFDLGISYIQAKQRGGNRVEVLADAAASVSPLNHVQYRYVSGKLALATLLLALAAQEPQSDIP